MVLRVKENKENVIENNIYVRLSYEILSIYFDFCLSQPHGKYCKKTSCADILLSIQVYPLFVSFIRTLRLRLTKILTTF